MTDIVFSERERTSRGKVRCGYCDRTITKGTRYWEVRGTDSGYAYTWRECPACQDAYPYVYDWDRPDYHLNEVVEPECFWEWAHEVLGLVGVNAYDVHGGRLGTEPPAQVSDSPQTSAAFTWLTRTSPTLHPQGITN